MLSLLVLGKGKRKKMAEQTRSSNAQQGIQGRLCHLVWTTLAPNISTGRSGSTVPQQLGTWVCPDQAQKDQPAIRSMQLDQKFKLYLMATVV